MTDDIVDYEPMDYLQAVVWAKERAKELRRQKKRIAELEAELETQLNWREHILRLEAELAALKARRCETCEANDKQYCPIPTRSNIIAARPSFSCSEWQARP